MFLDEAFVGSGSGATSAAEHIPKSLWQASSCQVKGVRKIHPNNPDPTH